MVFFATALGCGLFAAVNMNPESNDFEHNDDVEVDQLLQNVSESVLDNRSYYWRNFVRPLFVHHQKYRFVYSFQLPTITQSKSYYVASFLGPLLRSGGARPQRTHFSLRSGSAQLMTRCCWDHRSLVPRPHPSLREGEGIVKNGNIPGPEAGIWESQSDL